MDHIKSDRNRPLAGNKRRSIQYFNKEAARKASIMPKINLKGIDSQLNLDIKLSSSVVVKNRNLQ